MATPTTTAATTTISFLPSPKEAPSPFFPRTSSSTIPFPRGVHGVVVRAVASSSPKPKGEPRGIAKPLRVTQELQSIVGVPEIPRPHALKRIWDYIKDNNLQDPDDKKIIICDEKLKKLFGGKDRVGFLEIAGLISPHLLR
ncbi:hypothetical protein MLD38_013417 [Melastoma candidum]|uniref:Uncharacterized protein n=1 Tax=Melastoma candidum TaxID=119954 RepID=A0ACB9RHZ3_9MYRT|nr:hypothetical protein MLD38_013417 [Melastoma candidum]